MSETVKLIIEIPKETYLEIKDGFIIVRNAVASAQAIKNGIPLDDIKAEIKENKGEWIESKERSGHWYCSVCGGIHTDPETGKWRETFDYRYPFCPNCGADMREPKGEKGEN